MGELKNLTYLQKTALYGTISYIFSTVTNDADLKFKVYVLLKEIEKEFRPFVKEGIKELTHLDEEEIDKIALEVEMNSIPLELWIDKAVTDMKEAVTIGEFLPTYIKTKINKKLCRKRIVESAFVMFTRRAIPENPLAIMKLCQAVLETPELDFLQPACLFITSCCQEIMKGSEKGKEVTPSILQHFFDTRDFMSVQNETKLLKAMDKIEESKNKKKRGTSRLTKRVSKKEEPSNVTVMQFSFDAPLFDEETPPEIISEILNKKISEAFSQLVEDKPQAVEVKYVVRKSYNNIEGHDEFIKEFETEEEAQKFAQKIRECFPDLQKTCTFPVSKEIWKKGDK